MALPSGRCPSHRWLSITLIDVRAASDSQTTHKGVTRVYHLSYMTVPCVTCAMPSRGRPDALHPTPCQHLHNVESASRTPWQAPQVWCSKWANGQEIKGTLRHRQPGGHEQFALKLARLRGVALLPSAWCASLSAPFHAPVCMCVTLSQSPRAQHLLHTDCARE